MRKALCLAGGGIKGAVHIGALKAFEESNIEFDCISGTSSGSIVATLYAVGYSADEIYELFTMYSKRVKYIDFWAIIAIIKDLIKKRRFIIEGFNSGKIIEKIVDEACGKKGVYCINQIKKELIIPSVDLDNGAIYLFSTVSKRSELTNKVIYDDKIKIGKAVRASCSYPGVFCPCEYNGIKLIDGGIRENLPWKEWKDRGVEKVVCIGFKTNKIKKKDKNIIDIISSALDILCYELSNYELKGIEYLLKIKTKDVSLLDTKQMNYLYKEGYNQTKKFIQENKGLKN